MTSETTSSDDWRVSDWNYGQIVTGKLNDPVANCIVGDDAAYIAKVVNAHEPLLQLVRELMALCEDRGMCAHARELLASLE